MGSEDHCPIVQGPSVLHSSRVRNPGRSQSVLECTLRAVAALTGCSCQGSQSPLSQLWLLLVLVLKQLIRSTWQPASSQFKATVSPQFDEYIRRHSVGRGVVSVRVHCPLGTFFHSPGVSTAPNHWGINIFVTTAQTRSYFLTLVSRLLTTGLLWNRVYDLSLIASLDFFPSIVRLQHSKIFVLLASEMATLKVELLHKEFLAGSGNIHMRCESSVSRQQLVDRLFGRPQASFLAWLRGNSPRYENAFARAKLSGVTILQNAPAAFVSIWGLASNRIVVKHLFSWLRLQSTNCKCCRGSLSLWSCGCWPKQHQLEMMDGPYKTIFSDQKLVQKSNQVDTNRNEHL